MVRCICNKHIVTKGWNAERVTHHLAPPTFGQRTVVAGGKRRGADVAIENVRTAAEDIRHVRFWVGRSGWIEGSEMCDVHIVEPERVDVYGIDAERKLASKAGSYERTIVRDAVDKRDPLCERCSGTCKEILAQSFTATPSACNRYERRQKNADNQNVVQGSRAVTVSRNPFESEKGHQRQQLKKMPPERECKGIIAARLYDQCKKCWYACKYCNM